MASKEEIVYSMCLTADHSYGLRAEDFQDSEFPTGLNESQRKGIYSNMVQLYEHHIHPIQQELETVKARNKELSDLILEYGGSKLRCRAKLLLLE